MKLKLTTLVISILILQMHSSSQNISWGKEAKANRASGELYSLGWHNGFLYNIEEEGAGTMKMGGDIQLEKISKDMTLMSSKKIKTEINAFSNTFYEKIDDEFRMYTIAGSLKDKLKIIYNAYTLDAQSKGSTEIMDFMPVDDYGAYGYTYDFCISPNKEKMGYTNMFYDVKDEKYLINVHSFNTNGGETKSTAKEEQITGKLFNARIIQTEVDNKGNIIICYVVREEKPTKFVHKLLVLNSEHEVLVDRSLEFDKFFIGNITIKLSNRNEAFFTGMIGSTESENRAYSGFVIGKFNSETYGIEAIKEYPYTDEFFQGLGYKIKKDGRIKFSGSYLLDLELDNQKGGGYFIANHKDYYRNSGIANKEILVIPFDSELDMGDVKVVPRHLNSYAPLLNGLGYFSFIQNSELNIVYTDHIDNEKVTELDDLKETDNPKDKKAAIYLAKIRKGTPIKRSIISSENSIGGYLIPEKCQESNGKVVLNVGNKSKVLYGELKE